MKINIKNTRNNVNSITNGNLLDTKHFSTLRPTLVCTKLKYSNALETTETAKKIHENMKNK